MNYFNGVTRLSKVIYNNRKDSLALVSNPYIKQICWFCPQGKSDYVEVTYNNGDCKLIYDINEVHAFKYKSNKE